MPEEPCSPDEERLRTWRLLREAYKVYGEALAASERLKQEWVASPHVKLKSAAQAMYGCERRHIGSVQVCLTETTQPLWTSKVEEFQLLGHPRSDLCYAWFHKEPDEKSPRIFTLLKRSPIDSASMAVRGAFAAVREGKRAKMHDDDCYRIE